jgi:hypothetical protein
MRNRRFPLVAVAGTVWIAALVVPPATGSAQTVTGSARAVKVTTLGLLGGQTTELASTGTLAGVGDARDAAAITGGVPSVLSGEVLHAVTMAWPDQVASEASLTDLSMTVGAVGLSADLVLSRATAVLGTVGQGSSVIENLSINGVPVAVTGLPNQTISIPGGRVVINERQVSSSGVTVNALHAVVFGVADVVVGSSTAGIQ